MLELLLQSPPARRAAAQGAAAWSYKRQEVQSASPLQAILLAYEAAIAACLRQDLSRALEALTVLRGALDFARGGDIAARLQSLYLYCEARAREGRFGETAGILRELRDAWAQAGMAPAAGR
ncbi:MAG: flagellar export chaperone FliS [Candidatus Methylomirabilales bacterium]